MEQSDPDENNLSPFQTTIIFSNVKIETFSLGLFISPLLGSQNDHKWPF